MIRLPKLTIGTMTFGNPTPEAECIALMDMALERGLYSIDTANSYEGYDRVVGSGGGVAEAIIGRAAKGRRDRFVIATKAGMKVGAGRLDEWCAPETLTHQLEQSLRRIDTDYVDVFYAHRYDPNILPEELLSCMDGLVKSGKARAFGISNYSAEQLKALIDAAHGHHLPLPGFFQPPLSLLKQEALEQAIPLCAAHGIQVVPYQVFQGGLLTGKYRRGMEPPTGSRGGEKGDWLWKLDSVLFDQLEAIEREAQGRGQTMAGYALDWALRQPGTTSAIVGIRDRAQLASLLDAHPEVTNALL